jgi:hypothetical protein
MDVEVREFYPDRNYKTQQLEFVDCVSILKLFLCDQQIHVTITFPILSYLLTELSPS